MLAEAMKNSKNINNEDIFTRVTNYLKNKEGLGFITESFLTYATGFPIKGARDVVIKQLESKKENLTKILEITKSFAFIEEDSDPITKLEKLIKYHY